MRIVVTGGAGFVGGAVCRQLRERGDEVVAIVRDLSRASALSSIGATLVRGDLSCVDAIATTLAGADAALHAAGSYRIGIRASERQPMWDANVGATSRFLDAVAAARVPRTLYVSTANVFGNTRGRVVDESFHRDPADGFVSWYDRTKYEAHRDVERRTAAGLPIVIAMPGVVYGPADRSQTGEQLRLAYQGMLRGLALTNLGVAPTHVDDLATGLIAALDRAAIGESYVLAGAPIRLAEALELAARLGGHRLPRTSIPTVLLKALSPLGGLIGPPMGLPPNIGELVSSADGVTYWASSAKAQRELGYRNRDFEQGLRETLAGS